MDSLISGFRPSLRWSRSAAGDVILTSFRCSRSHSTKKSKSVHQLPGCSHFAHFAHLSLIAWVFFALSLTESQRGSSNFWSEEYRQRFLMKRRGVSPYGGLLVRLCPNNADLALRQFSKKGVPTDCLVRRSLPVGHLLRKQERPPIAGLRTL